MGDSNRWPASGALVQGERGVSLGRGGERWRSLENPSKLGV